MLICQFDSKGSLSTAEIRGKACGNAASKDSEAKTSDAKECKGGTWSTETSTNYSFTIVETQEIQIRIKSCWQSSEKIPIDCVPSADWTSAVVLARLGFTTINEVNGVTKPY